MRKIFLALVILGIMATQVFATTVDTKVSGDTVFFRTISWTNEDPYNFGVTPAIVTFNSVTKHIRITNLSQYFDCYVDLRCIDSNGKRGHITSASSCVLVGAKGSTTPNTVEFDFATHNLGFIGSTGGAHRFDQQVHYVVTGEQGDF